MKFNLLQKATLVLLFLSVFVFWDKSAFAQISWSNPYTLKKGHTIYLSSIYAYGDNAYAYINANGVIIHPQLRNREWNFLFDGDVHTYDWYLSDTPMYYTASEDSQVMIGMSAYWSFGTPRLAADTLQSPTTPNGPAGEIDFYITDDYGYYEETYVRLYFEETWSESQPPTGSITINDGAEKTDSTLVTLQLSATPGDSNLEITNMEISNDRENWTTVPYAKSYDKWPLESDEKGAEDTVYVSFEDSEGKWSEVYSATITYIPPTLPTLGMYQVKMATLQQNIRYAKTTYEAKREVWKQMISSQGAHGGQLLAGNRDIDGILYILNDLNSNLQTDINGSLINEKGLFHLFWDIRKLAGLNDPVIQDVINSANALLGFSYLTTPDPHKPELIMIPGAGGEPMYRNLVQGFLQYESAYYTIIGYTFDPTRTLTEIADALVNNVTNDNLGANKNLIVAMSYGNTIMHSAILQSIQNKLFSNSYVLSLVFPVGGSATLLKVPSWFPGIVSPIIGKYAGEVRAMNPNSPEQLNIVNNIIAIQQATKGIFYIQANGDPHVNYFSTSSPYAQNRDRIVRSFNSSNSEFITPPSAQALGINGSPHLTLLFDPEVKTKIQEYLDELPINGSNESSLPSDAPRTSEPITGDISNSDSNSDSWLSDITLGQVSDLGNQMVSLLEEGMILPGEDYNANKEAVSAYLNQQPDWTFDEIQQYAQQDLEDDYDADYLDEPIFDSVGGKNLASGQIPNFIVAIGQNISFTVSASSPSGKTLTYAATNLPTGASFSQDSITFSWTPISGQQGTFAVVFTATDTADLASYLPVQIVSGSGVNSIIKPGRDWSGSIAFDPSLPTITLPNGTHQAYTNNTTINLNLSANERSGLGVSFMQFSIDNTHWDQFQPFVGTVSYTLPPGTADGYKIVYVKFKDVTGNWSPVYPASSTIILDTTPPTGSISINGGATYTSSTSVNLTLSATDNLTGVTLMRFSDDGTTWKSPVPYNTTYLYNLPSSAANGSTQRVYVEYVDGAGHSSQPILASIIINAQASITQQPVNKTVITGQAATFSVTAAGIGPFTYQWQKNGVNISGATSASYTTLAATPADNNTSYKALVNNPAGIAVASNTVTLTVLGITQERWLRLLLKVILTVTP